MSLVRNRNFVSRGARPAQVFKKRNVLFDIAVPSNSNGTLLAEIILDETVTIYSIKVAIAGLHVSGVTGDQQAIRLWVRCAPAATTVPNFTGGNQIDTLNGFFVGQLNYANGSNSGFDTMIKGDKFRFRRKCDRNSEIELFAQSTNVNGTGRTVNLHGVVTCVLRVK